MTELLVGTKKGLFALEGEPGGEFAVTARAFAGEPVEYAMRDPRSGRVLASVTSALYGPKIWYADDPAGEWTQADGRRAARGRRQGARAHLGDRGRRGRRAAVRRRRPGRAVREPRRRRSRWELNRTLWEHPTRPTLDAGRRRAVPALDRPVAGRAGAARARDVRRRRVADRRRRRDVAARQPGPARRLHARGAGGGDARAVRPQPPPRAAGGRSGCSCSSTAASTAPTTRGRAGRRSATGCRRTSASRWRSTRPTPTAPT